MTFSAKTKGLAIISCLLLSAISDTALKPKEIYSSWCFSSRSGIIHIILNSFMDMVTFLSNLTDHLAFKQIFFRIKDFKIGNILGVEGQLLEVKQEPGFPEFSSSSDIPR